MEIIKKIHNLEIDKQTPLEVREKYYQTPEELEKLRTKIKPSDFFALFTCNRVSFFLLSDRSEIENFRENVFPGIDPKLRTGIEAIKHLFKIACGLESQIFAETDIINQIKKHFKNQQNKINPILQQLILSCFSIHKEFHTFILPKLKTHQQNLAQIVYETIKNTPSQTPLILVGYGSVNKAIHSTLKQHFKNITIFSNSEGIPKQLLKQKISQLNEKIIIISATNENKYILEDQDYIPPDSIIFDLSVPRTISPTLAKKYTLFDLDKLKELYPIYHNLDDQKIIHTFLNSKVNEFINKLIVDEIREEIKSLYQYPLTIAEEKINKYYSEIIKIIEKKDEKEIKDFLKYVNQKIINQTLEKPIQVIKDLYIKTKKRKVVVGTRGSKLALTQTNIILELLKLYFPDLDFYVITIKTSGDKNIFTTNSFVKELEEALIKEEIDIAIHSLKDVPYKIHPYLTIAAIPLREEPNDVLISKNNLNLWELKPQSIIGTSSLRRKIQLEMLRNDLIIKPIRGNVDSRIKKLKNEEYDAIVLSYAGIKRLKLEKLVSYIFPIDQMVPCPGQGAIAIQTRKHSYLSELLQQIDNPKHRKEVSIERELMGLLELGCSFPLGINAQIKQDNTIELNIFLQINNHTIKQKLINPNIQQLYEQIKQTICLKT
ncbi:MAG: hydroxymethylbilane synthase [bacterium]